MPPAGEARFVADQVICVLQGSLTDQEIDRFLQQNRLARTASGGERVGLLGAQVFRYRITDGRPVRTVIAALERDARVLSVQPNYWFMLVQDAAPFSLEAAASVPGSETELEPGRSIGYPGTIRATGAARRAARNSGVEGGREFTDLCDCE